LRAKRSNPAFLLAARWIASHSLSSGAHSRDPLARNDDWIRLRDLAACSARGFVRSFRPLHQRAQGMPGARCARCRVCRLVVVTHTRWSGRTGIARQSPRNGFTVSFVLSPVTGFVATVIGGSLRRLDASTGASGPHDFAVRVSIARQARLSRPPHPAPRFVTLRNAPRSGAGRRGT
jgi:hypothetical protein